MENPDIWALFDHPAAPTYYKKRFAILGDAAHASTPHQGAGAGQAIEDAYILSSLLGQINNVDEIEKAFSAYDAIRRPRSQKVVTTSRDAAKIYEFEDDELGNNLENIQKRLGERYRWIWDEDMVAQKDKAMDSLKSEGVTVNSGR
jgi:salicylate hydroxylase